MQINKLVYLFAIFFVIIVIILSVSIAAIFTPQSNKWTTNITQIDKLHQLGFYGTNVTIGIIDTGLNIDHQDFGYNSFIAWIDYLNNNNNFYDDEDHGTHITGILAAKGSIQGSLSGAKIIGISHESKYVIVKAIPQNQYLFGGSNDSIISLAIEFCIDNNVDIIMLSMGSIPENCDFISNSLTINSINKALKKGIFIVVPAGNDGHKDDGDVCFPGSLENVISVGAISERNSILSFSSKGHQYPDNLHPNKKPELVAPGDQILSTRINGAYGTLSGTSQAAAYVTGIIALLLDAYPEFKHDGSKNENISTVQLFKEIFAQTAKKIGNLMNNDDALSHDDLYGYGLIQAYDSYKELAKY
jgi:subtilisin family serine protease